MKRTFPLLPAACLALLFALSNARAADVTVSQPWKAAYTGKDSTGNHVIGHWSFDGPDPAADSGPRNLPGKLDGATVTTQSVTNADVLQTKQALSTDVSLGAAYLYRRDVNASGAITNADVLQVKQRLSTSIFDYTAPAPPPPAPGGGEFLSGGESSGGDNLSGTDGAFAALGAASSDGSTTGVLVGESAPTSAGPIDPTAWDAAILATYGQSGTKKPAAE